MTKGRGKYKKYEWHSQEKGVEKMNQANNKFAYQVCGDDIYILPHTTFYQEQYWENIYSNKYPAPKGCEDEFHSPSGPHSVQKPEYIFHFEKISGQKNFVTQVDNDKENAREKYVSIKKYIFENINKILVGAEVRANDPNKLCIHIIIKKENYFITLFENDLDTDSGNMHTFYGYVQFWKLTSDNKLLTRNVYGAPHKDNVVKGRELRFLLKDGIDSEKKEYQSAMSGSVWNGNNKSIYLNTEGVHELLIEEFILFVNYTKYF